MYDIFLCKDKGFSVIYHGVALQHEPLQADAPKREQVHFLRYYGSVQGTLPTNPLGSTNRYPSAPVTF